MSQNANEMLRELLAGGRMDEVLMLLRKLGPAPAAELLAKLPTRISRAFFEASLSISLLRS